MSGPSAGMTIPQRLIGKVRFIPAWGWLVLRLRSKKPQELWIGDSHAMSFNQPITNAMVMLGPSGSIVLRAGARLMHSLATKGFPPHVLRPLATISRWGRGSYVPFFVAGEIDVRTQMVSRPDDDLSWVGEYVRRCLGLLPEKLAPRAYFVAPPPPADVPPERKWVHDSLNGSVRERLREFDRLRAALTAAADAEPRATYLDFTDLMADDTGALRSDLTPDGCHSDQTVAVAIRRRLRELGLVR